MVRKLGRRWQTLHARSTLIAGLGMLHFWWMKAGKHDLILPKIYGAIIARCWAGACWSGCESRPSRPRPE